MNVAPDFLSDLESQLPDTDKKALNINEAAFGYRYIAPYLHELPAGARVLEVGSGPCLLLARLAQEFPALQIQGIEPLGPGFRFFQDFIKSMQAQTAFALHEGGYETLPADGQYDLIFLVNVFEHLPNWRHFLDWIKTRLKPQGRCVVLCPNYGFPYEPHFKIPILGSTRLTRRLFRKHIERYEQEDGWDGLWESLNFVKWSQVRRACRERELQVHFRTEILSSMVSRLTEDPEFAQRQKLLAAPATLMQRIGFLRVLESRLFQRVHPYMFLEIAL